MLSFCPDEHPFQVVSAAARTRTASDDTGPSPAAREPPTTRPTTMSSEQFESYEVEFDNIARSIKRKINSQLPNFTGEQRKACIRQATKEIERADDLLQEMEMESRSAPPVRNLRHHCHHC